MFTSETSPVKKRKYEYKTIQVLLPSEFWNWDTWKTRWSTTPKVNLIQDIGKGTIVSFDLRRKIQK